MGRLLVDLPSEESIDWLFGEVGFFFFFGVGWGDWGWRDWGWGGRGRGGFMAGVSGISRGQVASGWDSFSLTRSVSTCQ